MRLLKSSTTHCNDLFNNNNANKSGWFVSSILSSIFHWSLILQTVLFFEIQQSAGMTKATKRNASYTFRMRLFDNESSSTAWANFPRIIEMSKPLFAEVQLRRLENGHIDEDLVAIPKNCFFSVNSNPAHEEKRMVLQSGCSVNEANARFYSKNNLRPSLNNHAVRFSLLLDSLYFPGHQFVFFHCKATVCSLKEDKLSDNIKMCPSDDFCMKSDDKWPTEELGNRSSPYVNVFSGPLRLVYPPIPKKDSAGSNDDDNDNDQVPTWTVDGNRRPPLLLQQQKTMRLTDGQQQQHRRRCPPCLDQPEQNERASSVGLQAAAGGDVDTRVIQEKGIDVLTVFCIAVSSFFIGVLLMAGLCYVHKITEPKKCPGIGSNPYRKPLVDLRPSTTPLTTNNLDGGVYFPANNSLENTASTNVSNNARRSSAAGRNSSSSPPVDENHSSTTSSAAQPFTTNGVLLLAKPRLKLSCCYDAAAAADNDLVANGVCGGRQPCPAPAALGGDGGPRSGGDDDGCSRRRLLAAVEEPVPPHRYEKMSTAAIDNGDLRLIGGPTDDY